MSLNAHALGLIPSMATNKQNCIISNQEERREFHLSSVSSASTVRTPFVVIFTLPMKSLRLRVVKPKPELATEWLRHLKTGSNAKLCCSSQFLHVVLLHVNFLNNALLSEDRFHSGARHLCLRGL